MMIEKVLFDVDNKAHVELFKGFMVNSKWGSDGCKFLLEEPYTNVPRMIEEKLLRKFLNVA